ncbi:MAG: adaptor protein MecA [Eubacteriales bacterium]|nr:adaptor protein MecA [Eubacteriales bacterium]
MVYWKIDDETIRCLINKDEIGQLGFDLELLKQDSSSMSHFLEVLIQESHKYIEWNTENGVQNYAARALPANQFLITISCTFRDAAINRDIQQIRRMIQALNRMIPLERLDQVEQLTGSEKEEAFGSLSKDLHDVCIGKIAVAQKEEEVNQMTPSGQEEISFDHSKEEKAVKEVFPNQKITFKSMNSLVEFCSLLDEGYSFQSVLYRSHEDYILLMDFTEEDNNVDIITMLITAEEYGGVCEAQGYSRYYLQEHGQLLIAENALSILRKLR